MSHSLRRLAAMVGATALAAAAVGGRPACADDSTPLVELCERYLGLPRPIEQVTAEFIQLKSSCAGFINSHVKMSKPEDGFCVPHGYNMDDLAKIYLDWARKHPDRWQEPTKVTMTAALSQAYPCHK